MIDFNQSTYIQLAVDFDITVHQMDVKAACLNAPIDCEVYAERPQGFVEKGRSGEMLIWKLNKSLYGLKQCGRNWNHMLPYYPSGIHFELLQSDPCVYIQHSGKQMTILIVWVDDLIIASNNESHLTKLKQSLSDKFQMKDLGVWHGFWSCSVHAKVAKSPKISPSITRKF